MTAYGSFVISLDFEKGWGVHDVNTDAHYNQHLQAVDQVVPKLLQLFSQYQIHATWATVGMLFAKNVQDVTPFIPINQPTYTNFHYNPYALLPSIAADNQEALYFAKHLIESIQATPHQELATHTFSHFYALETGQTKAQFEADLQAVLAISERPIYSIVFPRNQINPAYLNSCANLGLTSYRGVENHRIYAATVFTKRKSFDCVIRLLDHYVNVTGYHTYPLHQCKSAPLCNIPSSRFLRPYNRALKVFEGLRLKRIKDAMTYAAKHHEIYHLWWHPHNMGLDQKENFAFLEAILQHFQHLKKTYNMRSHTMQEITEIL